MGRDYATSSSRGRGPAAASAAFASLELLPLGTGSWLEETRPVSCDHLGEQLAEAIGPGLEDGFVKQVSCGTLPLALEYNKKKQAPEKDSHETIIYPWQGPCTDSLWLLGSNALLTGLVHHDVPLAIL